MLTWEEEVRLVDLSKNVKLTESEVKEKKALEDKKKLIAKNEKEKF